MAKKPLEIDMIAGSQLRDTQGEMLSVEGADISELEAGKGRLNDNHGKGFFNSIGRVTQAKKIFKEEDCKDDPRLKHYWDKVKAPFIYVKGYLYDDEEHPNAKAAAAILRNIHKSDIPLQLKASVEGGVIQRGIADQSLLARTKIHSVALTFTPANNNTLVEPVSLDKSFHDEQADWALIKSVMHLAQTNVPSFRHIARDAAAERVRDNLMKIVELAKDAGLEGELIVPSKKKIIEKALEDKIKDNVAKINETMRELQKSEGTFIKECTNPECKTKITTKNAKYLGVQEQSKHGKPLTHELHLYNCPGCDTTVTHKVPKVEKGIKNAIAGAALGAATAMAPQQSAAQVPDALNPVPAAIQRPVEQKTDTHHLPASHQEVYKNVTKKYPLLGAIGAIESSGAQNYDHKQITAHGSPHYGHTAGGMFGMMPNTAAFMIKNDPNLAKKYPDLADAAKDIKTNHGKFTDKFNNDPQAAADFAISFYERNKSKTKNEQMLAHAWNNGLKGTWNKFKEHGQSAINSTPYVQNVIKKYQELKPHKNERKPALNKALTAGYGGAGSPTSLTGGGVMQTESLDQGRPNLKYVTCDGCGKEQVHSKYQVKCRHCGQAFSLKKLEKLL